MIFRLAVRNTLRNRRRTLLTIFTVVLGTMMLTVGLAWVNGIRGNIIRQAAQASGHVRIVTDDFARFESMRPLDEYIPATTDLVAELRTVPGVEAVYPRIQVGMLASDADTEELGDNGALVVGAPIPYFAEVMELTERLTEGRWFTNVADGVSPDEREDEAILGRVLAEQLSVGAGDEIILLGSDSWRARARVIAVADTGNGLYDKQAYLPLASVQEMAELGDGAFEILLFSDDAYQAPEVQAAIAPILASYTPPPPLEQEELPSIPQIPIFEGMDPIQVLDSPTTDEPEVAEVILLSSQVWFEKEPIKTIIEVSGAILGTIASIIVFITALGVLNTMLMSVLERTAEIGVLRAMGMSRSTLVGIFVVESILISILGGIIGATLGSGIAISMRSRGVDLGSAAESAPDTLPINRVLYPEWEPEMALIAAGLALVMALLGAFLPAIRALKIEPVTAMRSRR
jgi:putative ABC transport system permease protein